MPFNGSGTFTRVHDWVTDRINGIKILAARMDEEFDGIATGLSNTVTRDGQSTISANIPFNNKRITGLADATAATDALNRQTADARLFLRAEAEQSVASASTIDVSATGLRWEVTGTTGITTITMGNSTLKVLRFADAVTLTHHATTLILPGASDLTTAAGDVLWFMSDASGNARLMTYQSGTVSFGGGDMTTATYDAAAIEEQLVGLTATQTLSGKTHTVPKFTSQALTHNTSWDGTTADFLTVDVNGSAFTIANESSATTGAFYKIQITYTTSHSVTWGANFKGVSAITPTATAGSIDWFTFYYNGSTFELVGYTLDADA